MIVCARALGGEENVPGVFSDLVIHWHMINQDESTLLAGLI